MPRRFVVPAEMFRKSFLSTRGRVSRPFLVGIDPNEKRPGRRKVGNLENLHCPGYGLSGRREIMNPRVMRETTILSDKLIKKPLAPGTMEASGDGLLGIALGKREAHRY